VRFFGRILAACRRTGKKGKKEVRKVQRFFSFEKMGSSSHITREKKNLNLPYLENSFQQVAKLEEEF
jgi:hypothetical protein